VTELLILIEGKLIGRVRLERGGRLSLEYEANWRESAESHSLSVSMPLAQLSYPQKFVLPYLWNLLPENPNVLQRWAQQYHVSASSPFKLLAYVGADVPGAAQFIPPERLEEIQSARQPTIDWITRDELAERLRQLRADVAAVRRQADIGKMSLPGAQAKTAYYYDSRKDRWGVPGGRTPTTHIIKPCVPGFDGLVENEHLCQNIAARLGLPAANSFVLSLDETYIVVERYDRLPPPPGSLLVERIHQEDLCQALGLMPGRKYQEDGGPGIPQIVAHLRRASSVPDTDVDRFLRANIFNWLIGGTDGHAKNYSLLIGAGDEIRLAPLYDLSSQLSYPTLIAQRVAMKIGDHYDIARIGAEDWQKLARACALEEERVLAMVMEVGRALPDHISGARKQAITDGLSKSIIEPLAQQLITHVQQRLQSITAASYPRSSTRKRSSHAAARK
jgi:serine/threonine-protein kinase HipA